MSHSAVVGGSTAARVIACPPSRLSAEKIPKVESEYAKVGAALHECMELLFSGRRPMDIIGTIVHDVPITQAMFDDKLLPAMQAFTQYAEEHPFKARWVERHVELSPIPGAFGTADVVLWHLDNSYSVIDWKFGEGVQVDIEDNAQLLFYAAGVLFEFDDRGPDTFHLIVIQPNGRGLPTLRKWTVDKWALMEFTATLRWSVMNGHRDELLASGPHCRFCPVKPVCPKLQADVRALSVWSDPHPSETPASLGALLDMAENAELWAAAVKQYAHERLENGGKVDGWKLVPKRAIRKWRDESKAFDAIMLDFPHLKDAVLETQLRSPAQVEKILGGSGLPDGLTEARSSGTTLARDSDTRDAVVPSEPLRRLATLIGKSK